VAVTSAKTPLPIPPSVPPSMPTPERPRSIPPPEAEWIIAAMLGLGVALGAAGVIAYVETSRYGPAPPAEEGANEWATPNPKPPKSESAAVSAATSGDEVDLELEEPIIDVEINGSASVSSSP
jgi:hypothetical protein